MTPRVQQQLALLKDQGYRNARTSDLCLSISTYEGETELEKNGDRLVMNMQAEVPLFHGEDLFGFNISNRNFLKIDERKVGFGNVTIDYQTPLAVGLEGIRRQMEEKYPTADPTARAFYDSLRKCLDACQQLVERYRRAARAAGRTQLAQALEQVPMQGAQSYYQALVTLRFLQFALRLNGNDHLGLGRFDKYMLPYYLRSRERGMSREQALELTQLFFISLNFDTDIYTGLQQGDNGQSLVLGGLCSQGEPYSELTALCLDASEELSLIDPKINLRVDKNTPLWVFERATLLTKKGLGFPQYLNDDVIVPGLVALGYAPEHARDYTVAACWENIVPRYGADIPNVATLDFAKVVEECTRLHLAASQSFEAFLEKVRQGICAETDRIVAYANQKRKLRQDPFISAFILPCVERGRDISHGGATYYNFGCHGAGISTAVNALLGIKKAVFQEKLVSASELLAALEADFEGYRPLRQRLLDYPKMGQDQDEADGLAAELMASYADHLNGTPTPFGGVYRAGTGSAQEYVFSSRTVGATADGRHKADMYASSFSPSPQSRTEGLLSVIKSFTKFDMRRIVNGGPLTVELHDTVFRNPDGIRKVAMLVKLFIERGGHQLQLNSVNAQVLRDAQAHPERYANLIVRVWGWSGYFNELDVDFQNHIIRRAEFRV